MIIDTLCIVQAMHAHGLTIESLHVDTHHTSPPSRDPLMQTYISKTNVDLGSSLGTR